MAKCLMNDKHIKKNAVKQTTDVNFNVAHKTRLKAYFGLIIFSIICYHWLTVNSTGIITGL
jgi:hypothetical protein